MELEIIRPILKEYRVQDTFELIRYYLRKINCDDCQRQDLTVKATIELNKCKCKLIVGNIAPLSTYEITFLIDNFKDYLIKNIDKNTYRHCQKATGIDDKHDIILKSELEQVSLKNKDIIFDCGFRCKLFISFKNFLK